MAANDSLIVTDTETIGITPLDTPIVQDFHDKDIDRDDKSSSGSEFGKSRERSFGKGKGLGKGYGRGIGFGKGFMTPVIMGKGMDKSRISRMQEELLEREMLMNLEEQQKILQQKQDILKRKMESLEIGSMRRCRSPCTPSHREKSPCVSNVQRSNSSNPSQRAMFSNPDHGRNYKTVPCKNWDTFGNCPYGSKCNFIHVGEAYLTSTKYRTVLCRNWASGNCTYGEKCTFIHN